MGYIFILEGTYEARVWNLLSNDIGDCAGGPTHGRYWSRERRISAELQVAFLAGIDLTAGTSRTGRIEFVPVKSPPELFEISGAGIKRTAWIVIMVHQHDVCGNLVTRLVCSQVSQGDSQL